MSYSCFPLVSSRDLNVWWLSVGNAVTKMYTGMFWTWCPSVSVVSEENSLCFVEDLNRMLYQGPLQLERDCWRVLEDVEAGNASCWGVCEFKAGVLCFQLFQNYCDPHPEGGCSVIARRRGQRAGVEGRGWVVIDTSLQWNGTVAFF